MRLAWNGVGVKFDKKVGLATIYPLSAHGSSQPRYPPWKYNDSLDRGKPRSPQKCGL
jgi:hypothetical protein